MNTTQMGKLIEINRYPVKSFSGETLQSVDLAKYGLLGDRGHAFVGKEKSGWARYITARKIPQMIGYHAQLIITNRSIEKLQKLYSKRLDHRRFRANFLITLAEDINEADLIGRRLMIGNSELTIKYPCERCAMITIDPDTLEKDVSLLKLINENMNLQFGLYADVTKVGTLKTNDGVYLIEV